MNCQECREACGVVGVLRPRKSSKDEPAAALALRALAELQHRGQESAGLASCRAADGLLYHRGLGQVAEAIPHDVVARLSGSLVIGHTRYSTAGDNRIENAQPIMATTKYGSLAVGHNGNLTNAHTLRRRLIRENAVFKGTTDTEVFLELLARQEEADLEDAIISALSQLEGAYCFVILAKGKLFVVRDPFGIRPLVLGWRGDGTVIVASESCVFSRVEVDDWREIVPGEMVKISRDGVESVNRLELKPYRGCIFELIYFARPDSVVFGLSVSEARRQMGCQLARQCEGSFPEVIVPVPDSAIASAYGFAHESGVPLEMGLLRDAKTRGRSFLRGDQTGRRVTAETKLIVNRAVIERYADLGIDDDSIVRGTTVGTMADMLRRSGARRIHMLISSPKIIHPCFYGIDTADRGQLCAAMYPNHEDLVRFLRVNSATYLTLRRLLVAVGYMGDPRDAPFCYACFDPTGDYRGLPQPDEMGSYLASVAKTH